MPDHSPYLDHVPGWLAGLCGAVAAGWAAVRARRNTLADTEAREAAADAAEQSVELNRLEVFGRSFKTLQELLSYLEARLQAVVQENETLRLRVGELEKRSREDLATIAQLRLELATLKGQIA